MAEGGRALYCSRSCKNAMMYARRVGKSLRDVIKQPERVSDQCIRCGSSLEGMRPHAVYCSRRCKVAAANDRRYGREPISRGQVTRVEGECAKCGLGALLSNGEGKYCSRRCYDRARYWTERGRRLAYAVEYHRKNPHVSKAARAKRKAAIRGDSAGLFGPKDWSRLLVRYRYKCAYCGIGHASLQVEHVIPLSRGGLHRIGNIVPACAACNYSKHTSTVMEWRMRVRLKGGDSHPKS